MPDLVQTMPRRLAFALNVALAAVGHIGVPWAMSLLTVRHGWTAGRPAAWNVAGLVPCAIGLAGLVWCLRIHFERASADVELKYVFPAFPRRRATAAIGGAPAVLPVERLATSGPYGFSRNPMYVSVLLLWLGWALFFGSLLVGAWCLVTGAGMALVVVPAEERQLEAKFGEDFRSYAREVGRWLGRTRTSA